MKKILERYIYFRDKGKLFPAKVLDLIQINTPVNKKNYVERTGHLRGSVFYTLVDSSRCKTRHIGLNFNPLQCTDNCVLHTGIPCPYAIVFISDCKLDVNEYVPKTKTYHVLKLILTISDQVNH